MKTKLAKLLRTLLILYVIVCGLLYIFQERVIFFPQKLDKAYQFRFEQDFEEVNIPTSDSIFLHGLLFKADSSRGLIYYLHGNSGSLSSWGRVAKMYTDLDYDVFMLDYRGFGKSEGSIESEDQFFQDLQQVYDHVKKDYPEEKIIILGYSIGTGPAAKIASDNSPRLLILQAPYYSLTDMLRKTYPIIPTSLLKYKFATYQYLEQGDVPVVIFHGDKDQTVYYGSSLKLRNHFNFGDTLITLSGQGHNGITDNEMYRETVREILMMLD